MEVNRKFLLQIFLPALLFAFILGILLGVLFHFEYSKSDAGLAGHNNVDIDNKSDMKNAEEKLMPQQFCECQIVDNYFSQQPLEHESFHPLRLDSLGEFQIDIKFRGFHEEDVGIIVFTNDTSQVLMIEIGLYKKKDIIIYNETWHQLAKAIATFDTKSTALDHDHDHCDNKKSEPQVKDWRSFLIKYNSFETSFQVIEASTSKLLFESILPRDLTVKSYKLTKRYNSDNNLQSARSCSYLNAYGRVFNGQIHTSRQVKACQGNDIVVVEEFFCQKE